MNASASQDNSMTTLHSSLPDKHDAAVHTSQDNIK